MQSLPALAAASFVCAFAAGLPAQLNPVFVRSFVDTFLGGTGNIGVTQDEVGFDYYVVAFQNAQTVHRFDILGTPLTTFTSTMCIPSLPSPNDITYDPTTETLWLVDNNGSRVLQMDLQGACLGGWTIPIAVTNAAGICVDRSTGTLFISHTGAVLQCDQSGNMLGGGFSFTPPTGTTVIAGITHVPATDRFLLAQSSGTSIYEVDRSGGLISTTPMSGFGIVNIQGLHYNPVLQQLVVVDNSLSTTFVFDLPFCNGTVVQRGVGCVDGGGVTVWLGASGCADVGGSVLLEAFASPNPVPMLFAGGASDAVIGGLPLPLSLAPLGAPGCWIYTSSEAFATAAQVGSSAALTIPIPNIPGLAGARVFLQALKLDLALTSPLQLATSNYLTLTVQ